MGMSKKGMELSLTTIIVAIIVILVAVVLIMIFTGFMGDIFPQIRGMTRCESRGGHCTATTEDGHTCFYKFGGCDRESPAQDYCCIPK